MKDGIEDPTLIPKMRSRNRNFGSLTLFRPFWGYFRGIFAFARVGGGWVSGSIFEFHIIEERLNFLKMYNIAMFERVQQVL